MEKWKVIPGWSGYRVSNTGRIQRIDSKKYLTASPYPKSKGKFAARSVGLSHPERGTVMYKVAVLVLLAFRGRPKKGQICRHLDDNQTRNCLSNLRWGTHKQNANDRIRNRRSAAGERHGSRKLSWVQVKQICAIYVKGSREFGGGALGAQFKVHPTVIREIANGKLWKRRN